ncbi:MAG: Gfo/Idh/MocA family protein [Planctomycetota bacterium]|jgi:predicted dehydrogenase
MAAYRCGVVGCGGRSRRHAQAYPFVERGELVACCDLIEEKRDKYAKEFGLTPYADAAEMIEREKLDLVHLVTWPDVRVPTMTVVSDAGVAACIVEKPIATAVADWKKLCELEAASKTRFAVNHQFRWQETLTGCREALASGKLGEILFLEFTACMNISGQGTHVLDYGMSVNDDSRVVRVFGAASGMGSADVGHPAPNTTVAGILFENGVRAFWNNGPTAPMVTGETDYQHVRLGAYCESGRVLWEEFGKWQILSAEGLEEGTHEDILGLNDRAQAALTMAMFDWIEDDAKPAGTNLNLGLHQWKSVLALYASALWRRPVELADFDPPDDLFEKLGEVLKG